MKARGWEVREDKGEGFVKFSFVPFCSTEAKF